MKHILYVLWLVVLVILCVTFFKGHEIIPIIAYLFCWIYGYVYFVVSVARALEKSGGFLMSVRERVPIAIVFLLGIGCLIF